MTKTDRILGLPNKAREAINLIAAFITITNFIFPIKSIFSSSPEIDEIFFSGFSNPSRIVLLTIVESSLAWFFGRLFGVVTTEIHGKNIILYLVIGMISAWLSLFNIQYILLSDFSLLNDNLIFIAISFIFVALFCSILIYVHVEEKIQGSLVYPISAISIQIFAFIIIWYSLLASVIR